MNIRDKERRVLRTRRRERRGRRIKKNKDREVRKSNGSLYTVVHIDSFKQLYVHSIAITI